MTAVYEVQSLHAQGRATIDTTKKTVELASARTRSAFGAKPDSTPYLHLGDFAETASGVPWNMLAGEIRGYSVYVGNLEVDTEEDFRCAMWFEGNGCEVNLPDYAGQRANYAKWRDSASRAE